MNVDRRSALLVPAALPLIGAARPPAAGASDNRYGALDIRHFGAKLDGTTDDSEALQRAIDACLRDGPARPLAINGPCRLERSAIIDRPVDKTRGVFRIVGGGRFGGFIAAGDFPMFDSRLVHPSAPLSEHIWFQNIRFEALPAANKAMVMTGKFLRVQFQDCEFERIRALATSIYAQEWHFSRCIVLRWPGVFFDSSGGYHVTSTASKYQNGSGHVFQIVDPDLKDAGCVGCAFHQDITEANAGSYLRAAIVQGLSVSGLYSEGNSGPTLDFEHNAPNRGISVTGCMFAPQTENKANPGFFEIRWGRIEAGHAGGNFTTGRLHHHRGTRPSALAVLGDYAELQLIQRGS